ncbi:DUF1641 domain-containing protein [Mycolicibacterium helvum]|uniref:DUF1641 domain-containing protein n=1 Tax=Mycolicibacterium helvum TaxID=1534349 RepID=A0A7I7TCU7_9MYCO|nr:DUF1641 domain-containing protein [Mycolicibacterium helvum]BBY65976.1 hypothetical protein MHEL_42190 [Mycolicibacterium helvum]
MTANGQAVAVSPADQIRDKLDDPKVAASLNNLLDHADLLAVLVTGLDGLVRRGDVIADSLSCAVNDFKGASVAGVPGAEALKSVDLQSLAQSLATLSNSLVGAAPALNSLLSSRLTDPQTAEVLAALGQALVDGKAAAAAPGGPKGLFGLWKVTKDPDVVRGLGFMIQVARSFGRQVGQ